MQVQKIFDDSGVWVVNKSAFVFVDPTNGCRFESGVRTKAPITEWVKMQEAVLVPEVAAKVEPKPAPVVAVGKPKA